MKKLKLTTVVVGHGTLPDYIGQWRKAKAAKVARAFYTVQSAYDRQPAA